MRYVLLLSSIFILPFAKVAYSYNLNVLSNKDTRLYQHIFYLEQTHHFRQSNKLFSHISDKSLLGYVLAKRYLSPYYHASYQELRLWLRRYHNLGIASRIYAQALLKRRHHRHYLQLQRISHEFYYVPPYIIRTSLNEGQFGNKESHFYFQKKSPHTRYGKHVVWKIAYYMRHNRFSYAKRYLRRNRYHLRAADYGDAVGEFVKGYVSRGMGGEALHALPNMRVKDKKYSPQLLWWMGLAAYQDKNYSVARIYFEQVASSSYASADMRSAAYFWLARVCLKCGQLDMISRLLEEGSYFRYTFYGLLAERCLGFKGSFVWGLPNIDSQDIKFLLQIPAIRRGFALASVGQIAYAEKELIRAASYLPPELTEEILILASQTGLARVSYDVGKAIRRHQGMVVSAALYPIPIWSPIGGFHVNPALIYAFMRQESTFKVSARSYAGARGLMQLMPSTASLLTHTSYRGHRRNELYNPTLNISLGQRYVYQLSSQLNHNLFLMVGAYNAGAGNMIRWFSQKKRYQGDPLLFVETLSNDQTRNYIKKVIASFWIYQSRFGQYQETMDQLLSGEWPQYHNDHFSTPVVVAFNG